MERDQELAGIAEEYLDRAEDAESVERTAHCLAMAQAYAAVAQAQAAVNTARTLEKLADCVCDCVRRGEAPALRVWNK